MKKSEEEKKRLKKKEKNHPPHQKKIINELNTLQKKMKKKTKISKSIKKKEERPKSKTTTAALRIYEGAMGEQVALNRIPDGLLCVWDPSSGDRFFRYHKRSTAFHLLQLLPVVAALGTKNLTNSTSSPRQCLIYYHLSFSSPQRVQRR